MNEKTTEIARSIISFALPFVYLNQPEFITKAQPKTKLQMVRLTGEFVRNANASDMREMKKPKLREV
jgi:hypothetical protein